MDFRNEYKKEIADAMPDEQAMERIRRGVAEKLTAAPKRKAFPVRRAAAICGSAAACLIIGAAAITLTSNFRINSDGMFISPSGGANMATGSSKPSNPDCGAAADAGEDINGGTESITAGGADSAPTSKYDESAVNGDEGFEKTDDFANLSFGESCSDGSENGSENAMIVISDNRVILTVNGTVTRFAEVSPAGEFHGALPGIADSKPDAAESVTDSVTGADNIGGTTGVSEDNNAGDAYGDSSTAGALTEPESPETNFVKVTADNGETMFIQQSGSYLRLYNIDYELLGVFVEV